MYMIGGLSRWFNILVGTAHYSYVRASTAGAAEPSFAGDYDVQQQGTRTGTILCGLTREST